MSARIFIVKIFILIVKCSALLRDFNCIHCFTKESFAYKRLENKIECSSSYLEPFW